MKTSDSKTMEARLVFDSADLESRPDVRRTGLPDRQQMFIAEPYSLNLRIEHVPGSSATVMVGQITGIGAFAPGLGDLYVDLAADGRTLAEAKTSGAGEFQLEYEPVDNMRLQLRVPDEGFVELPVDRQMTHYAADARPDPYELADWVWSR